VHAAFCIDPVYGVIELVRYHGLRLCCHENEPAQSLLACPTQVQNGRRKCCWCSNYWGHLTISVSTKADRHGGGYRACLIDISDATNPWLCLVHAGALRTTTHILHRVRLRHVYTFSPLPPFVILCCVLMFIARPESLMFRLAHLCLPGSRARSPGHLKRGAGCVLARHEVVTSLVYTSPPTIHR
jgi:hypothetical protein